MAAPLLDAIDIEGKDITADALLTQKEFADYLVRLRHAHYHFTVKKNQPTLFEDIRFFFQDRKEPNFILYDPPDHGRIETRKIWITSELNNYLNFPHVGQAFVIERESIDKKTGKYSKDVAYGITSRTPEQASAQRVLETNRFHWSIGRVENWRVGLGRCLFSPLTCAFVCKCHSIPAMPRFQFPPHRSGRADFPHPALGQDIMLSPTEGHGSFSVN